ncbi:MAG: U32 family peptidase, partial [bacterium]
IPAGTNFIANELSSMEQPFIADLFFNVTNIHAIHFLGMHGARSVTLSAEMSQERIRTIAQNYQAAYGEKPALEIVAYGLTDLMISRYCPIAKTFGTQSGCTLCERNQYHLKDRLGYEFPLINDGECNIRVLNSRALNLIDFIAFFRMAGLAAVRLDFTIETAEETRDVIAAFQKAILKQSYVVNRYRSTHGRFLK